MLDDILGVKHLSRAFELRPERQRLPLNDSDRPDVTAVHEHHRAPAVGRKPYKELLRTVVERKQVVRGVVFDLVDGQAVDIRRAEHDRLRLCRSRSLDRMGSVPPASRVMNRLAVAPAILLKRTVMSSLSAMRPPLRFFFRHEKGESGQSRCIMWNVNMDLRVLWGIGRVDQADG
jgi:hypothetical protein